MHRIVVVRSFNTALPAAHMQDSSLSDAAQLGRSSLAAAVPEPSAGPAAAGAPTPLGMPARHDETASNRPSDHGGHPYQHHARGSSYSAAPRGGHFATDPTANRPSLADYGHAGSAPVQSTSKWFESGASPGTHRPLSVPLPTSAPLDHRPSHRQSQEDASARTFPPISRLHQQWSKTAQSQYTPYRMSIAPEPPRPAGGSGEAGAEAARMQAPSYPTYQSAPYSGHAPAQSSSYTYPPPTSHGEPAYPQPLSLTLPPLSNAFPSEPFALTATYPPPSDNSHARYGTSGMLNQQQTAEPASLAGSSRPHHLPTIQESYKSYQPMPMPLTASMPRANGAETPSYAESISAAVPPGSAQPNSRKRKEPKDAATRKYACNECEQKFARPSALATHIVSIFSDLLSDYPRFRLTYSSDSVRS